jgi:hypothetical protein
VLAETMDVLERDHDPLLVRDVDTDETGHSVFLNLLCLAVLT